MLYITHLSCFEKKTVHQLLRHRFWDRKKLNTKIIKFRRKCCYEHKLTVLSMLDDLCKPCDRTELIYLMNWVVVCLGYKTHTNFIVYAKFAFLLFYCLSIFFCISNVNRERFVAVNTFLIGFNDHKSIVSYWWIYGRIFKGFQFKWRLNQKATIAQYVS